MSAQKLKYTELLREELAQFRKAYGLPQDKCATIFDTIVSHYGEGHRTYHGLQHPVLLFDAARDIRRNRPKLFRNSNFNASLDIAIFAHDIIYDPKAEKGDNEKMSAELAFEFARDMGFSREVMESAKQLTLATTHDFVPTKIEEQIMVDIDLSLLGIPWDEFVKNSEEIRVEYKHVPTDAFNVGRKAFLNGMLPPNRSHIYSTEYFYNKLEAQAHRNIQRALTYRFAD